MDQGGEVCAAECAEQVVLKVDASLAHKVQVPEPDIQDTDEFRVDVDIDVSV